MAFGSPLELHSFDVEAQRGTDRRNILAVNPLHYGGFPSIVEAPEHMHRASQVQNHGGGKARTVQRLMHSHHEQSHFPFLLFDLLDYCEQSHDVTGS